MMHDHHFRAQLKAFTADGALHDYSMKKRVQAQQAATMMTSQQLKEPYVFTKLSGVEEMLEEIPPQRKRQNDFVTSQRNINTFLSQTQSVQRRDIPSELTQTLTLLQDDSKKQQFLLEQQNKLKEEQLKLENQKKIMNTSSLDIAIEFTQNQNNEAFFDTEIIERNEKFVPYMYVLASYLDLRNSTLFIRHYDDCVKLATLANQVLLSQSFADYVNQFIVPCDYDFVMPSLLQTNDALKPLLKFFTKVFQSFSDLAAERPTKRCSTYLQTLVHSQDTYLQFFVTCCFWKLGGGQIQEDEYRRFPTFVQ
ncbi:Conserved_hypothetical protein [Hexamita inflata]|uniref:Uncharacterized protein n=1 Tax=Hexamita inflata TaxID=28002 RepID=A0AA86Q0B5_9EUKA|nr:Conserved hypothetical protein [Hexamita inflata]CAI9954348.1 Conserved hypothetical protein [Hexamita inflata]CAI9977667.1 Conserved hypothetical protein [Hexamita inflata]